MLINKAFVRDLALSHHHCEPYYILCEAASGIYLSLKGLSESWHDFYNGNQLTMHQVSKSAFGVMLTADAVGRLAKLYLSQNQR